ncbi:MAG: Ca-activated chloride channel family protein, partial [Nonlabens sp.]
MKGYKFSKFIPQKAQGDSAFDNLLNIFLQLVSIT